MKKPILNIDEVAMETLPASFLPQTEAASRFGLRMGEIGGQLGSTKLGYNLTAVPPGKRAFPFHSHRYNEEMFFIVSGHGEIRVGGEVFPLRSGDVVCCPPGGPESAHQIINNGEDELRYLAVSTMLTPEIVEYPDSGKFGVRADYGPDADGQPRGLRFNGRMIQHIDYWDGE